MGKVIVANPHGFCAGVIHAMELIESVLAAGERPVYCLNELVHNKQVVEKLKSRGVKFVRSLAEVETGATVFFSAHGVSPSVRDEATKRGLSAVDATCPFVEKVHKEVIRYAAGGCTIIFVGHAGHDEVVGVVGEAPARVKVVQTKEDVAVVEVADPEKVAVATQTTLGLADTAPILEAIKARFPKARFPKTKDICFATENRQKAVEALARMVDGIVVLGSPNSSNSLRLVEIARRSGVPAKLVSSLDELGSVLGKSWEILGLTAGASTPEEFVNEVLEALKRLGFDDIEQMPYKKENVIFRARA